MQYEMNDAEVKLLLAALDAVQVAGIENQRRFVAIADKLTPRNKKVRNRSHRFPIANPAQGAPGGG